MQKGIAPKIAIEERFALGIDRVDAQDSRADTIIPADHRLNGLRGGVVVKTEVDGLANRNCQGEGPLRWMQKDD